MKWFEGDIASAISLAKNRGSIFTVYCEGNVINQQIRESATNIFVLGKDEYSKQMTDLIQHESIASKLESERFVAIRLFSDKEEYMMFAKICKFSSIEQGHVFLSFLFNRSRPSRSCSFDFLYQKRNTSEDRF